MSAVELPADLLVRWQGNEMALGDVSLDEESEFIVLYSRRRGTKFTEVECRRVNGARFQFLMHDDADGIDVREDI